MTLLLSEGCDSGLTRWVVNNNVTVAANSSYFGSGYDCFRFANAATSMSNYIKKEIFDESYIPTFWDRDYPEIRVSFWLKLDTTNVVANSIFLRLSNGITETPGVNADWQISTTGRIQAWQLRTGVASGIPIANASPSMPSVADGNWHFIEIFERRYSTSSSNGDIQLWVDRTNYISTASSTGFAVSGNYWDTVKSIQIGNVIGANVLIDDIVVWNDEGSQFRGNTKTSTRIYTLRPIGDDSVSNTIVSEGTVKYSLINEANINTQSFIRIADSDRFNMSDINVSSNIYAGCIITHLIKDLDGTVTNPIRVDTLTNKGSFLGISSNTFYSGENKKEFISKLDTNSLGNTSSLMNSLKVEIKKELYTISAAPFSPLPVTDGLILHLDATSTDSYPGTGTKWYDLSPYRYTATLVNGVTYENINSGRLQFDGSNDYVNIPSTPILRPSNMTIFTWLQPTAINKEQIVVSGSYRLETRLWLENTRWGFAPGASDEFPGSVLFNNNWYCLCVTYTPTDLRLYKNGVLETVYSSPTALVHNTSQIRLCQGVGIVNRYFAGPMSLYAMYNRAITADEVMQNFFATKDRFARFQRG